MENMALKPRLRWPALHRWKTTPSVQKMTLFFRAGRGRSREGIRFSVSFSPSLLPLTPPLLFFSFLKWERWGNPVLWRRRPPPKLYPTPGARGGRWRKLGSRSSVRQVSPPRPLCKGRAWFPGWGGGAHPPSSGSSPLPSFVSLLGPEAVRVSPGGGGLPTWRGWH